MSPQFYGALVRALTTAFQHHSSGHWAVKSASDGHGGGLLVEIAGPPRSWANAGLIRLKFDYKLQILEVFDVVVVGNGEIIYFPNRKPGSDYQPVFPHVRPYSQIEAINRAFERGEVEKIAAFLVALYDHFAKPYLDNYHPRHPWTPAAVATVTAMYPDRATLPQPSASYRPNVLGDKNSTVPLRGFESNSASRTGIFAAFSR